MRLKKKISRQSKIFKKAINAKWAFYWAKFMTEAATICRKYAHEVIEGKERIMSIHTPHVMAAHSMWRNSGSTRYAGAY